MGEPGGLLSMAVVFDFFLFLLYPNLTFTVYSEFLVAHTLCVHAKWLQSCSTLCSPMDCNLLGSSVHGILQATILEWVAIASSRGSSPPRD